ncbi:MAG: hypothetical protein FWG84_03885 [Bacteroidales bacterium]|nr:hypothetical protein [Bacteroidales bacterium]
MMKNLLLAAMMTVASVNAQTIKYVKVNGNGDGASWKNAAGDIQTMIDAAGAGNQVWIAGGTYLLSATLEMKEGVNVYGGFEGNETGITSRPKSDLDDNGIIEPWEFTNPTVLNGKTERRVLNQPDNFTVETVWDGVTITEGFVEDSGGGAYTRTNGMLLNCTITGNSGDVDTFGGGVYNDGGVISHSLISDNTVAGDAAKGAGIYNENGGIVEDCLIENNEADRRHATGGGISGGVADRCIVRGNSAGNGGGFSDCTASNCLIDGNVSTNPESFGDIGGGGAFGGLYVNCTFANNRTGIKGSALYGGTAINCIFWNNTGAWGQVTEGIVTYSAISNGHEGAGNIDISGNNDVFADPDAGNYQLKAGSPCIDVGSNDAVENPTTAKDLAGNPRIYNAVADMGAYEWQGDVAITEMTTSSMIVYPNPTNGPLRITCCELRTSDNRISDVEIFDVMGRAVHVETLRATSLQSQIAPPPTPSKGGEFRKSHIEIDISHLPAGVYIVKIGEVRGKFVKE